MRVRDSLLLAAVVLASSLARADTAPATPPVGAWQTDLRVPLDFVFAPGNTSIGLVAVGLGVGKRISEHWLVGTSAEVVQLMDVGADNAEMMMRWQLGGAARWYFHDGTAAMSIDDGPYEPVPRHDWVEANAGVQEMYGGVSAGLGEFAELSLGMDCPASPSFQVGVYVTAGLSVDPAGAFQFADESDATSSRTLPGTTTAPPNASSPNVVSPYVALGWRFAFGRT